jgi:putative SOS response-associated peptidase YedK
VVRNTEGGRELAVMRWGMPPPPRRRRSRYQHPQHLIAALARLARRRTAAWSGQQLRRICAGAGSGTGKKDIVWFARSEARPLFSFAGIWTEFRGDRGTKSKPIPGPHLVYGFLTTAANAIVEPIHPRPCR